VIERRVRGDGVELAAIQDGPPERPVIVFVHGYPDTKELWMPAMAILAARFHLIAYDVRGFGGSSAPRGPLAYGYEHLAGDLEAVIDALAGGRPVHLVGHDWGGIAGWELASRPRLEGRLRSFTSIAGPSLDQVGSSLRRLARRGQLGEVLRRVYRSWYVLALCAPGGPTLGWAGLLAGGRWSRIMARREGLEPDPYLQRPSLAADGRHGANLYRRNILMRLPTPPRPAPALVPVQLIIPTRDRYISETYYEQAERYAPRLLRRGIEAGHWVPRSHPAQIAELIAEFVEEVEAA
jgi:pimeloyl-ACP methyl ester carboxylesterase